MAARQPSGGPGFASAAVPNWSFPAGQRFQIDGLRVGDHVLVAAIGIDGAGDKHVLAVALGATENAAVVKALLADLIERALRLPIACVARRTTQHQVITGQDLRDT
jgi:hypothetical protein